MERTPQPHPNARRTVALVLAGGRGSRLKQLTGKRARPALDFGGKFRIIDFALSNCVNSGIRRIGVLTQYKSHSLLRHLQRGWTLLHAELGEMVGLLPAQQRVLAGDPFDKMDHSLMLEDPVQRGAGCTVGRIELPRDEARAVGVMAVDGDRRITEFAETPNDPPPMPDRTELSLPRSSPTSTACTASRPTPSCRPAATSRARSRRSRCSFPMCAYIRSARSFRR